MDRVTLFALRDAMSARLQQLEAITVGCVNCVSFKANRCIRYDATPPDDVRAIGCDEWQFDGVPF